MVIKSFYGTSPNAVKTQVWIALIVYLLVAIVRKHLRLSASLHTILTIIDGQRVRDNSYLSAHARVFRLL
jgi:hypothetical protein